MLTVFLHRANWYLQSLCMVVIHILVILQYSEKDRYQIDKSYMPSTVNLIIKSIEHIQEDLGKRDWFEFIIAVYRRNGITAVYGDVTQQLFELNTAVGVECVTSYQAAKKLSHFVVVPRVVSDGDGLQLSFPINVSSLHISRLLS